MLSSNLILCRPLLLLPPIPPSIRVFSNESALHKRWPKYWSFSFSIIRSNEHPGLISFRMDWLDLPAVQRTLKSLLQHHNSKASIPWHSAFFTVQLSHPYMTTGKTIALIRRTFVGKVMSLLLNMLSRLVITFLPRSKNLLISWLQSPSAVIFEPPKNKVWHCFHCFPSISHEVMGPDAMILVFQVLRFKPTFSLSSFTFIKRLFSSSSLSAIRVLSSAYLRLLVFLPAILIPACASSSPAFLMMYSAYKLNKQGEDIQPWWTLFPIWNQSVVPCTVQTVALWPAYRFLKRQVRWSGTPISFRIFHTLLNLTCSLCFYSYPMCLKQLHTYYKQLTLEFWGFDQIGFAQSSKHILSMFLTIQPNCWSKSMTQYILHIWHVFFPRWKTRCVAWTCTNWEDIHLYWPWRIFFFFLRMNGAISSAAVCFGVMPAYHCRTLGIKTTKPPFFCPLIKVKYMHMCSHFRIAWLFATPWISVIFLELKIICCLMNEGQKKWMEYIFHCNCFLYKQRYIFLKLFFIKKVTGNKN